MSKPLVSLCMPTNGVVEWVFKVLESIYEQECDEQLFEVVITDNGDNVEFKKMMREYVTKHMNIIYVETNALPFLNEIESYKRANGELIKFVNHRTKLVSGTLQKLINLVSCYSEKKPIIYCANGVLDKTYEIFEYDSFDEFVKNLSYWSSWSTGMTIWKSDMDKLPDKVEEYNELFPHTTILFQERNREKYIIDNTVIFEEIPQGRKPKGNYDLFFAFGVEYPGIICDLLRDMSISIETYRYVIDQNLDFIISLYYLYFIKKEYCSYDLMGIKDMYGVFYSKKDVIRRLTKNIFKKITNKLKITHFKEV